MHNSIERYYQILGISSTATFPEIKKAYRKRAKELHPDVNKSPNAHAEFILLSEGYEYLMNVKTGKIYSDVNTQTKPYYNHKRWQDDEAARARHRAEYFANMNYQKYSKSKYYEKITSINVILGHLGFFFAVGIIVILPIIITVLHGVQGLIVSLILIFISLPLTIDAVKIAPTINLREFYSALQAADMTTGFAIAIVSFLNFILFFKIGLQTMIPLIALLLIFATAISLSKLSLKYTGIKVRLSHNLISYGLLPLLINLFLSINFYFSTNPQVETYNFKNEKYMTNRGRERTTFITLAGNKYEKYYGIRVFASYDELAYSNKIKYTFKDGLLGIRVMYDYEFIEIYRSF